MNAPGPAAETQSTDTLRAAGARFAFVHGSRAGVPGAPGAAPSPSSDLDVAAWWGRGAPAAWEIDMPIGVDLLVLDGAPLWLAGRVAMWGRLLFVADPAADVERMRWQVDTRVRYLDELPGMRRRYAERARQRATRASRPRVTGRSGARG